MLKTLPPAEHFAGFVLGTGDAQIPPSARARVQDLILDLVGVSAASGPLDASRIAREMAVRMYNTDQPDARARILFDGRTASLPGAAYAGATQIDSLDAHDGYSEAKGHAGCGLLPGVLAFAERRAAEGRPVTGPEFVTAMVLGYEIASRAGVALHGTVSDYHTSGAWVAVAVAALGVRLMGGDAETLRHAIGIAEYHGPRSQMMREIDNPTMLHDGSGWGSMVGVSAAEMALAGFEGAPAITVEADEVRSWWADLGTRWLVEEQNIKLFPVCRWAHAPIHAAMMLRAEHGIAPADIAAIEIHSFHEATRLALGVPETTGKAQYSINYPVAAALVFGKLGTREIMAPSFGDPEIARLVALTEVFECPECIRNFPADRLGRTVIVLKDGRRLDSGIVRAPGEHTEPIDRAGLIDKFHGLAGEALGADRARALEATIFALDTDPDGLAKLTDLLYSPL